MPLHSTEIRDALAAPTLSMPKLAAHRKLSGTQADPVFVA
jgi:hypothetical protein